MEWLQAHWDDVVLIITSILGVASMIAALTPTEADNAIINKILAVIHTLGLTKK